MCLYYISLYVILNVNKKSKCRSSVDFQYGRKLTSSRLLFQQQLSDCFSHLNLGSKLSEHPKNITWGWRPFVDFVIFRQSDLSSKGNTQILPNMYVGIYYFNFFIVIGIYCITLQYCKMHINK